MDMGGHRFVSKIPEVNQWWDNMLPLQGSPTGDDIKLDRPMPVKEGGPDVNNNSRLKAVVAKAKANNMTNDTIERSIKKAAGDVGSVNYEKVVYEGYGPSGTAIIVVALTDNKNRTAANVRNAFTKGNGNVGTQGCVSYMFDEKGRIIIDKILDGQF